MSSPALSPMRRLAVLLFLCITLIGVFKLTQPKIINFENFTPDPPNEQLVGTRYILQLPSLASRSFSFLIDGCLETVKINGTVVPLAKRHCKSDGAFVLEFPHTLENGLNELLLMVSRTESERGFANLAVAAGSWSFYFFYSLFALLTAFLMAYTWRILLGARWESRIIFGWALLAFLYLTYTPWDTRANDAIDHFDYILYVVTQHKLPQSSDCWQCFQMPGYYVVAAAVFQAAVSVFKCLSFSVFLLQYLTLWTVFAFLLALRRIYLEVATETESRWLFLFVLTMPSLFLHSVRIGNDTGMYALATFGVLYMLRFWRVSDRRNLRLAFTFVLLAYLVKASAVLAIAGMVGTFALAHWLKPRARQFWPEFIAGLLVFAGLYAIKRYVSADTQYFQINQMPEMMRMERGLRHFLTLDWATFFAHPSALALNPDSGREFYWSYFIKSFSHGEFPVTNSVNIYLAHARNVCVVLMLLVSLALWIVRRKWRQRALPILIFSLALIAGHIAFQFYHPFSSSADARLVYPGVILFLTPWLAEKAKIWRFTLLALSACGLIFLLNFFVTARY